MDCFNFVAAANLSAILNKELKVANLKEVFATVSPESLALPRLGAISLAVLGAAFEAKGIGGERPLEAWVHKHLGKADGKLVTFDTLKTRDQAERTAERKATKARKHARRNQAHKIRLERLATQTTEAP